MVISSKTILLTGIPRSGTTLCCHLLNRCEDTLALHEPLDSERLPDSPDEVFNVIRNFLVDVREQALQKGTAPSKQVGGTVPANPVDTTSVERKEVVVPGDLLVGKPLTNHFSLIVKHNALFTGLLPELAHLFRLHAIIRNPLPVLASWRSVSFPVSEGRLPMGEKFSPALSDALRRQPDLLERQLLILKWFFRSYRNLDPDLVLSYEEIVSSNGKVLRDLVDSEFLEPGKVEAQYGNSGFGKKELTYLASELTSRPEIYEPFYSPSDIELMLDIMSP